MRLFKKSFIAVIALALLISLARAAQLDTLSIPSQAMQRDLSAVVVVPERYFEQSEPYPVVYLLHGWSGSYRDWSQHLDLRPLADRYQFIILCPDGGYAGWYLDSPRQADSQYNTYIAKEVVAYTDAHYRTIADSSGRFICGLSMGGHGALTLLCKHPDTYIAAGSMSGVMELTDSSKKFGLVQLLGEYESHSQRWQAHSALFLIEELVGKHRGIILDCGTDDFLITSNRQLHQKMMRLGLAHDYYERPGGHGWDYWTNAVAYHLLYFSKFRHQQKP